MIHAVAIICFAVGWQKEEEAIAEARRAREEAEAAEAAERKRVQDKLRRQEATRKRAKEVWYDRADR